MAKGAVKVRINGDASNFKNALASSGQAVGKFGAVVKNGMVAAGVAIAATATKAVNEWADFERGTSEIFTLLPGISEKNMGEMRNDILEVNKEMGITSDQSIPAVYDSLSAGVPKDNVFAFLRDAQKLAIAGNVDTAASTDYLTTYLNSYKLEVEDTARVSDIAFTTIKYGKTTLGELGASMFQVAPMAGQLGIRMEDLNASVATLTSVGIPTAQTTTMLKAALSELVKDTSEVGIAFKDVAGVTFTQFIERGGTVEEVLGVLEKASDKTGKSVLNLFSSGEAGQAMSSLVDNKDTFVTVMNEMENSTGATQEAYDVMSSTLSFKLNQLKAHAEARLIELGSIISPYIVSAIDKIQEIDIAGKVRKFFDKMKPEIDAAKKKVGEFWSTFSGQKDEDEAKTKFEKIGASLRSNVLDVITLIKDNFTTLQTTVTEFTNALIGGLGDEELDEDGVYSWAEKLGNLFNEIFDLWTKLSESPAFGLVVDSISQMFRHLQELWDGIKENQHVFDIILNYFGLLAKVAIVGVVMLIVGAFKIFAWILGRVVDVLGIAMDIMGFFAKIVTVAVRAVIFVFKDFGNIVNFIKVLVIKIFSKIIEKVVTTISSLDRKVRDGFNKVKEFVKGIPGAILEFFKVKEFAEKGKKILIGLKDGVVEKFQSLKEKMGELKDKVLGAISNAGNWLKDTGKKIIQGLIDGIKDKFQALEDTFSWVTDKIPDWKGPEDRDKKLLTPAGQEIINGLNRGLAATFPETERLLNDFSGKIAGGFSPSINANGFGGGIDRSGSVIDRTKPQGTVVNLYIENINGDDGRSLVEQIRDELSKGIL